MALNYETIDINILNLRLCQCQYRGQQHHRKNIAAKHGQQVVDSSHETANTRMNS